MHTKLVPKLWTVLQQGYTRAQFSKDLVSGVIVGIVALPLSIAFAIASGVKPEQGLYTAIFAGFLISVLSGSNYQIGGPAGAFIVLVYDIVQKFGYDGLAQATMMAGVLMVIMGIARLGAVIKFIPYPLTVGFTSGIATIIFVTQIRDFLGLTMEIVPADFMEKIAAYAEHIETINPYAAGIGLVSILIIVFWPRVTHRIPAALLAIVLTTALVQFFDLPVETIAKRFGSVPDTLPMPRLPHITWERMKMLSSPALAIAVLCSIESLLCAVVADGMTGTRHRSNMEILCQGIANIVSPIFGGIPATGTIARTATNIKNGGQTPVAGMIHAITLLLIMLFFGKWAALIPMATLGGILIMVAYNMGEWHIFTKLASKGPRADVLVMLVSFSLTVLVDLTVAIEVGLVLASFLFMNRMADAMQTGFITKSLQEDEDPDDPNALSKRIVPPGVEVFEIYGPFFFGAADKFKDAIHEIEKAPKILILRMRHVVFVDATALRALEDVFDKTKRDGTILILSGIHSQPMFAVQKAGLFDKIGEDNVCGNIDHSLERANEILSAAKPHK